MRRRVAPLLCASLLAVSCGGTYGPGATTPAPTPTYDLSGRVTETPETGSLAIAGATIVVADGPNAGRSVTTDTSGNYRMTGLQPSGFTVTASAPGYVPASRGVTLTEHTIVNFGLAPAR